MFGQKKDWVLEPQARHFVLDDYEGRVPRWCPGCGDHAVLTAVQKLARDEQLIPEDTVFVSGIGCSGRFPHYMKTFGFHGLHGRAFPVACGVRSRRPDLNVFMVTGDGDCCAIGTGHWIHAIRYNMDMTVLLLDNNIYGLTKMQTSPTSPRGQNSYTHPDGSLLDPLNPLSVTLGIANVSFVAQTFDWNPPHVAATIAAAHAHKGTSFVRILQRCPHFMPVTFNYLQNDPEKALFLDHENGIHVDKAVAKMFKNKFEHDPTDLSAAQAVAMRTDFVPLGLLYHNPNADRYDRLSSGGLGMTTAEKAAGLEAAIDRFTI